MTIPNVANEIGRYIWWGMSLKRGGGLFGVCLCRQTEACVQITLYLYIRNGLKPCHFVADEKQRIKKDIEAVVPRSDLEPYCNSWDWGRFPTTSCSRLRHRLLLYRCHWRGHKSSPGGSCRAESIVLQALRGKEKDGLYIVCFHTQSPIMNRWTYSNLLWLSRYHGHWYTQDSLCLFAIPQHIHDYVE